MSTVKHEDLKIMLVVKDEINLVFLRANLQLCEKYAVSSTAQLIELWKLEYSAELVLPEYVLFKNQVEITTFMLKYS